MKLYINCTAEEATHIAKDRYTTEKLFIKPYELPTDAGDFMKLDDPELYEELATEGMFARVCSFAEAYLKCRTIISNSDRDELPRSKMQR